MIAWTLTTSSGADTVDRIADVASTRSDATTAVAEALRCAILGAGRSTLCAEPTPAFTVTMDGTTVASLQLTRNELGKLAVDRALDYIDQFERDGGASDGSTPGGMPCNATPQRGADGDSR